MFIITLFSKLAFFQPDVLEMLVQNGANLHARTKNQETPYGETSFSKYHY